MTEDIIPEEGLMLGGWSESVDEDTDKLPDHLWRTLVADRGPDGGNPPLWYRRAMLYCLANRDGIDDVHTNRLIDQQKSSAMVEFLQRVSNVIWNKRLFLAKGNFKHRFGLAPTDARPDDLICVLLGCSVPVVLRQHGEGSERYYEFVGEAYVYGMMDGEAVAGLTEEEIRTEALEFRLRQNATWLRRE
ncbi:hypothetical protein MMC13_002869 [Lambiella insularis]|nr:hypothetical protein [Lambiella insularis]